MIEHHRQLVIKMMRDWGYDGLKLDGQHMNGVPPCFNPAHHHARPEESVEDLAKFFQMIYDTARSIKPDALVEWCPCGTAFNFYNLPNLNMSVASDPHNSWQVRTKGKSLKALHGDATAYFGDHVELSDGRQDFASTLGIGGVVGTQFTWPVGSARRGNYDLTPEKEEVWQKWISLYKAKMLSQGEYRGDLYDIGFDRPETHAIRKAGSMYYAFFAPEFQGKVELRGLDRRPTPCATMKTAAIWARCGDRPGALTCSSQSTFCSRRNRGERQYRQLTKEQRPAHLRICSIPAEWAGCCADAAARLELVLAGLPSGCCWEWSKGPTQPRRP